MRGFLCGKSHHGKVLIVLITFVHVLLAQTRRKPILSESKYVNALISRISLAFGVKETDGIIERYIDEILELTVSLLDKNHQLRFMALFTKLTMIKKRTGSPVDGGNLFNEYIHFQRGYDLSNSVESKSQKKDKFIKFRLTDPTAKKYLKMPSVSQDETLLEDGTRCICFPV